MKTWTSAFSTASVLILTFFFQISGAFALSNLSLENVFDLLKNQPRSYETKGAICEEVAKVLLEQEYPAPRYTVHVGIAYGDLEKTIGELDEVVIDNQSGKAIRVYEVKCWTDLKEGREKALAQRSRFLKALRSSKELYFNSTSTQEEFSQEIFEDLKDFMSLGQKGATAAGYEFEFPFTMRELMDLRTRLLRCQSWGDCPRP